MNRPLPPVFAHEELQREARGAVFEAPGEEPPRRVDVLADDHLLEHFTYYTVVHRVHHVLQL